MIINSFDNQTAAIIEPQRKAGVPSVDVMIITFSYIIEEYIKEHFNCTQIATLYSATGLTSVYQIDYKGKKISFYKTYIGAPCAVGLVEDVLSEVDTDKVIMFGGAGCLDKDIARGKIMIPTEAYRDEGTSYHYAPAADYITLKNSHVVADFMKQANIPYVLEKHGRPMPFTEKQEVTLKSVNKTVVSLWKWNVHLFRRCVISEVWSFIIF